MTDTTQAPINGNFPAQHAYPDSYNPAAMNAAANFQPAYSSTPSNAPATDQKNGIAKDEVGWYFVEQYYTSMSRCPDKLHLFYSRRSQFVFGTEAESVPVAVGQKAINDKIKQLDFQECKVRVLNVDSQASFDNILITVVGEISNKSEPSRKFVQTFVLAEQPNGYYVLNDIFRYLTEEEEEFTGEEPAPASEQQQQQQQEPPRAQQQEEEQPQQQAPEDPAQPAAVEAEPAAAEAQVDNEPAATKIDEKLEEAKPNGETAQPAAAQTNGGTESQETAEAPAAAPAAGTESAQTEYPPSPETTPTKEAPAEKEATSAPAVPKTWANIASKSGAAAPVVPAIPVAPPKAPAAKSSKQAAPAAPAAQQPVAAPAEPTPSQPSTDNAGWQTAGHDHRKTQSRGGDNVQGYIKNVNDKVDASLLRQTLNGFGNIKHFDVNRPKNCAFVEFEEPAGYAAAVAANPHQIGSEQITVEERRRNYGNNFGPGRGGSGRGRGDRAGSQGRGGFQRDGRGGFARGRGGNLGPKGRNQATQAA